MGTLEQSIDLRKHVPPTSREGVVAVDASTESARDEDRDRHLGASYGGVVTLDDDELDGDPCEWPYPGLAKALAQPLAQTNASNVTAEEIVDEVTSSEPPRLNPGRMRPYVPLNLAQTVKYAEVLERALKLLLYAPEVVTASPWFSFDPEHMNETNETVKSLVSVWDLVTDGSLFLREMPHPLGQYASYGNPSSLRLDTPEVVEQFGFTPDEEDHWVDQAVALELWPRRTTPWFITEHQTRIMEDLVQEATHGIDRRALQLPKLAALELPSLELHTPDLIAVRRSSDTFAAWRQQLGTALSQVELLPDSDAWQREARAIIADELTPYTERLLSETSKSSALSSAVTGMKQLAVAGIGGAVGGLAGGSTTGALAGLSGVGAATLISGMSDWLKAQREAAPKRALLQLAMVFDDRTS